MAKQRIWSCRDAEALLGLTGGLTPEEYLEATAGIVLRLAADGSASGPDDAGEKEGRVRRLWSLPLGVEPNRGQTDPRVKVLARGHGRTLFPSSADAMLVTRLFGFARGNVVLGNRIRGRARAALSIPAFPLPPQALAVPTNNAFVLNRFDDFAKSVADMSVGAGAMNTLIVGRGTVEDHGVGTIIVTVPPKGDHEADRHGEGENHRRANPAN